MAPIKGTSNDPSVAAVDGQSSAGVSVSGVSTASGSFGVYGECAAGHGVHGKSATSRGVAGFSDSFQGVYGHSDSQAGVAGESKTFHAVYGVAHDVNSSGVYGANDTGTGVSGVSTASGSFGVYGECAAGHGVHGKSASSRGVAGFSDSYQGVYGHSERQAGVVGESTAFHAVFGIAHDVNSAGIYGTNDTGSGHAGYFEGDVHVTRVLTVERDIQLMGADLAEQFEVVGELPAEPGCVVVLAGDDGVRVSDTPYDHRVAGVVSGAGSYRPALVLDSRDGAARRPLALTGKVWCNVDADSAPVEVGDLLTTSATPGHAMRAADPARAFGAVIGKALRSLPSGRGLIPVIVALQ